jgi:hypothetical protein
MDLAEALQAEFGPRFEDLVDALPRHRSATYPRRPLADIRCIVVHHTAARRSVTWQAVARYHVSLGWPGVAYHVGLRLDAGGVTVALLNQPETRSYHAHSEGNSHGLAVVVAGDFSTGDPTAEELDALRRVVRVVRRALGRALPALGHCAVPGNDTDCPGPRLAAWLAEATGWDAPDALIWAAAKAGQAIRPNPESAIGWAMRDQSCAPIGNEAGVCPDGVWHGVAQLGLDMASGAEAAFFASNLTLDGQWAVRRVEGPAAQAVPAERCV